MRYTVTIPETHVCQSTCEGIAGDNYVIVLDGVVVLDREANGVEATIDGKTVAYLPNNDAKVLLYFLSSNPTLRECAASLRLTRQPDGRYTVGVDSTVPLLPE